MKRELDAQYEEALVEFGRRFGDKAHSIMQAVKEAGDDETKIRALLLIYRKAEGPDIISESNVYFCHVFAMAHETMKIAAGYLREALRAEEACK